MRTLTVLGATGSVGASTLDLIRRNPAEWRVEALTANCQAEELARLAREFGASIAVVGDESCLPLLREALAGSGIEAAGGARALVEAAARPVDLTVAAIVGCAGLAPTMAAIEQGGTIALANKEALVSAGEVLTAAVDHEIAILRDVIAERVGAREQLEAAVASFVRRALTGPNLAYAFIAEPAEPEVDAERIRCRKRFGDVFKAVLKHGVASGEFPKQNLDASAACLVGAFTEALVGPIGPSRKSLRDKDRLVNAICAFCARAVGAID